MTTTLLPEKQKQLNAFWNLILASDSEVQEGLFALLAHKYQKQGPVTKAKAMPFLQMRGRLKSHGDANTDRQILEEYLQEKYSI